MKELWRFCRDGKNTEYYVSTHGRIKSLNRNTGKEIILKIALNSSGYPFIKFYEFHGKKVYLVHRLVAEAFIANTHNATVVNHLNFDKTNPHVDNLEWCTIPQNNDYTFRYKALYTQQN